jgi:hypothetical protein
VAALVVASALTGAASASESRAISVLRPQFNPLTGLASAGAFDAVSCPSSITCVAVGRDQTGSDTTQPIELIGNPATWTGPETHQITLGRNFGEDGTLSSVSCITIVDCVAVGWDDNATSSQVIVVNGNPATWDEARVKQILVSGWDVGGQLLSVSCTAATMCVAVGESDGSRNEPIFFRGNPGTWNERSATYVPLANASALDGSLDAVTCLTSIDCVAVGSNAEQMLSLSGNPVSWGTHQASWFTLSPQATGNIDINAVTCESATDCVAVGDDYSATPNTPMLQPIVMNGNPATWGAAQASQILLGRNFGGGGSLSAIECESDTNCVAVGSDSANEPISMSGDPTRWGRPNVKQFIPNYSQGHSGYLDAVACGNTTCVALGANGAGQYGQPIGLLGTPGSWNSSSVEPLTLGGSSLGANGTVASLSCTGTVDCVGVGTDGNGQPLVFHGNPAQWGDARVKQITLGAPYGFGGSLTAVDCLSNVLCVAVGSATNGEIIELRGDPSSWGPKQVHLIQLGTVMRFRGTTSESIDAELTGISCPSVAMCVAVGDETGSAVPNNPSKPIVIEGNPAQWSSQDVHGFPLTAAQGFGGAFDSVSCPKVTSCVAVGSSRQYEPLFIFGDPATWSETSIREFSVPKTLAFIGLDSVTCPAPTNCIATGIGGGLDDVEVLRGTPSTWAASELTDAHVTPSSDQTTGSFVTNFSDGAGTTFISCQSALQCVVAGDDWNGAPFYFSGNPAQWTIVSARRPANTPEFSAAQFESDVCDGTGCFIGGMSTDGPFTVKVSDVPPRNHTLGVRS